MMFNEDRLIELYKKGNKEINELQAVIIEELNKELKHKIDFSYPITLNKYTRR